MRFLQLPPLQPRVLVCGGRDFQNRLLVFAAMDLLHDAWGISEVIHGAARGADSPGDAWVRTRGVHQRAFPADWNRYGNAAGPLRNTQMLKERPDLVVAFPGGRGTQNMVEQASRASLYVWKVHS